MSDFDETKGRALGTVAYFANDREVSFVDKQGATWLRSGHVETDLRKIDGDFWEKTALSLGDEIFFDDSTVSSKYNTTWGQVRHDGPPENKMFIVGLDLGHILTSPDGVNWTESDTVVTVNKLNTCFYNNNLFVAVGVGGLIITSPDSITWTQQTSGVTSELRGVTYGSNLFVVVGDDNIILTSPDGITWTQQTVVNEDIVLRAIDYRDGLFIASGTDYISLEGIILTSTDGITWAEQRNNSIFPQLALVYHEGTWVIGGNGGIIKSTDGFTWEHQPIYNASVILNGCYGNGLTILGDDNGNVFYSIDLINWHFSTTSTTEELKGGMGYAYINQQHRYVLLSENCNIITYHIPEEPTITAGLPIEEKDETGLLTAYCRIR
jgi:photosystem II stability/assembly factor-like uncharacterized protein